MRREARAEGHQFLDRLASDWASGAMRFDRPGEALLAAYSEGVLAAIGGITIDPIVPDALRMRRFYVRPAFRRAGLFTVTAWWPSLARSTADCSDSPAGRT
jgi:hypothetical protein